MEVVMITKKRIFLILLICCWILPFSVITEAEWAKTYDSGGLDISRSIQQTSDGGYILVGASNGDIAVLKLDSDGNIVWQKTYGSNNGYRDVAYSVQQTSDGGYIVAGGTDSFGAGSDDVLVLKLDPDGNVLWQKTYGGTSEDRAYSIQQTMDEGYIVAGYTYSFGLLYSDAWIIKLDSGGDVLWQKTFGGSGFDFAYSIQQSKDEGYIIAGSTRSFESRERDAWILKLNSDGDVLWQKTYGGWFHDSAYSIQQTTDGGYIIAGSSNSFDTGYGDVWIFKLDSHGNILWQKTYGGTNSDWANSIQQTSDGGYIVAGETVNLGINPFDALILKLDSNGNVVWQKTFGGSGFDSAVSVYETSDGGYIVAGDTTSLHAHNGNRDFWVLKLNANGEIADCQAMGTPDIEVKNTNATLNNLSVASLYSDCLQQASTFFITNTNMTPIAACTFPIFVDSDHDGYYNYEDCNDNNPAIHPGAIEVCDGVDNNCNGMIDEGLPLQTYYQDADSDGYGNPSVIVKACKGPTGYVSNNTDCNDNNRIVYPGAPEIKHDGIDQDCNGYDLSITIIKANYKKGRDELRVEATSSLKENANLYVVGYGAMKWKPTLQEWTITVRPSGGDPLSITVCGVEGCESADTKAE